MIVTLLLGRLKLPVVAGLVLSGALVGPKALSLAHDPEAIEVIAEVGVIFLLFTIGLEFSLSRLKNIFRQVALGGLLQVGVTTMVTSLVCLGFDLSFPEAVVYGFVFALSSTALVLRTLGERGELDAPHGRFIVGTLIFQDLCIVPMVLIVPLLANGLDKLVQSIGQKGDNKNHWYDTKVLENQCAHNKPAVWCIQFSSLTQGSEH